MQRSFRIDASMKKSKMDELVNAAQVYIASRAQDYSPAKNTLLALILRYAKNNLVAYISKDTSRYIIYSNIIDMVDYFDDDIHFLAYVVRQVSQIKPSENSTFRATVLPTAENKLKSLLAHEFLKQRRACLGLAMGGLGLMYADPRIAFPLMMTGLISAYYCEDIVYLRLKNSLNIKLHRLDAGTSKQTGTINDGLEDVFGRISDTTTGMLNSGLNLFSMAGQRMQRLTMLGNQSQARQTQRRVEIMDNEEAIKTYQAPPPYNPFLLASAPEDKEEKAEQKQYRAAYN